MGLIPYKRGYSHSKERGQETKIPCSFCGKLVPRWKTFPVYRGFTINDPLINKDLDRRRISSFQRKMYACPGCARFRGIVKPGRSRTTRVTDSENQ
jgi:ribosomal protein S26